MSSHTLLEVRNLTILGRDGAPVIDGVCMSVGQGEIVGVLGESGSGKTILARGILGFLPEPERPVGGAVLLDGRDLLALSPDELAEVRGNEIALIPSGARRLLNPVVRVGDQIAAVLRSHRGLGRREARTQAAAELGKLAINDPERRAAAYPHELSGGMCQRVVIAMAFCSRPRLVICDDATSGLDVTVQALVLRDLTRRVEEEGAAAIVISHDVGIIAQTASRVSVMGGGRVVEEGPVGEVLVAPVSAQTARLVELARLDTPGPELARSVV